MNKAGRSVLVKVTMTEIPIYLSIAVALSPWVIQAIDKLWRACLWWGKETAKGGYCLVAWPRVCCPRELGGLGIIDLHRLILVLRMCWEWL